MTLQQLNDLDLDALRNQLGDQFTGQADNLKAAWRDVAKTAQAKNPLPLSQQDKEHVGSVLVAFAVTSVLMVFVFLFYRAIVKSGVKAALNEHHDEMVREWSRHRERDDAGSDYTDEEPDDPND
ncbi:hypothetical protein [Bifidobacterium mongoliense]|uniref:hypothetical protein n=1 Tax=Bifidobacterium mongoliense TaxID=518643 RepID=UPI0030EEC6F6